MERNPDDSEYAARDKHGTIKIGHGIEVTNGEISVPDIPMASETVAGLVKIGANVDKQDGAISIEGAAPATHEKMGVVKLGDDFFLAEGKSLKLVRPKGFDGASQIRFEKHSPRFSFPVAPGLAALRLCI